jgi:glycosyltransferase involved in cell wall biosynthesis
MSVLEAWSYRLPSLITPECNLPVGFEQCAAIQINTNSASISTGMLELFEMSDRDRDEFGGRAYQLVASKFTWRSVAEQMLEVYKWILGGGDAPSCVRFR